MGQILFQVYSYIQHCLKRKDEHSLHSPFLFNFYVSVVKNCRQFQLHNIEEYRRILLGNEDILELEELGAGKAKTYSASIKSKAKSSLSPLKQSCFIGSLVHFLKPVCSIELGTSFGVSTSYMAKYADGQVITLEGSDKIALTAKNHFSKAGLEEVQVLTGLFETTLPKALEKSETLDFVFFDGNHRYNPTIQYFDLCLERINENSVFLFHDIYWSEEMNRAWSEIRANSLVTLSIDLYHFGIVFFRKNQPKQHFTLKF